MALTLNNAEDAAIALLADKYNGAMTAAATMFNCMNILASGLDNGNVFGHRAKTIESVAIRLRMIAHLQLPVMGIDLEQVEADLHQLIAVR